MMYPDVHTSLIVVLSKLGIIIEIYGCKSVYFLFVLIDRWILRQPLLSALAIAAVTMLFALGPIIVSQAFAYSGFVGYGSYDGVVGYGSYTIDVSYHHHSHHHHYHHYYGGGGHGGGYGPSGSQYGGYGGGYGPSEG